MDPPGLSLFKPEGLDIVHEADVEDDQDDVEEALQIEEKIDKGLSQAMDDLESNLGDEEEEESMEMPVQGGHPLGQASLEPGRHPLDTPPNLRKFHKLIPESSPMQSTPIYGEGQYINSGDAKEDLNILYQARGNEINRLNDEIQALSESKNAELRIQIHKVLMLETAKNNLVSNVEQLNELLRGSSEENKALKEEINHLKSEKERDSIRVREANDKLENSEYMIRNLQTQVQQLQKSDALLKARQQHDAIVRSLKERHESEVFNLQEEVDKLFSQVRRQEVEVSGLRTKLLQKDLVEPSKELEERMREKDMRVEHLLKKLKEKEAEHSRVLEDKSKVISKLNARLDENQKRVSELISEKISTKQLENDIKIAEMTLKSLQKENEELRISTNTIEMKAQHFESLAQCKSNQELDPHLQAALEKSMNDIIQKDKEISSLKQKLASLELEANKSSRAASMGVSDEFSEKVKSMTEELSRVTNKYLTLKKKVKAYQDHCQRKEEHYREEIKRMEEEYKSTLLTLKSKMEVAYNTKEQEIEIELMELKDHFYMELEKITSLDKKKNGFSGFHGVSSPDEFLNGISECSSASKKENTAPISRLEEVDRVFARAQEDAKNKIASLSSIPRPFSTVSSNHV